ncbi:MAG: glycosyltransferase [Sphingobium sp.]|nr:glycosyltransferase [Sphingobium sp.]
MASSSPRDTIFFVINSLAGGGAERVMTELVNASHIFADRYDIALVLLDDEPRAYAVPEWVTVYQLNGRFSLIHSMREFHALAKRIRPSVTLSFLTRANFVTVASAARLGFGAIISERVNTSGHFVGGLASHISKFLVRTLYPRADHVIAVSAGIADDLRTHYRVKPEKMTTIANPVDRQRIRAAAGEPVEPLVKGPYAIAISRLSRNKNAILTVEGLAASRSDLSLLILGQGPEQEAIKARAAELGLADRVVMPGFVANPYPYLAGASCYLSGSNAEGFPNGLVEALALGVPAISANCPSGPSEILADKAREEVNGLLEGLYGILVPQNDAAAMGEAINRISQSDRAAFYSEAGARRAADYSVEGSRDQYWHIIEAVRAMRPA